MTVLPEIEPIFPGMATHIEIDDDGAVEFLVIKQDGGHAILDKAIAIDGSNWHAIKDAIDAMLSEIATREKLSTKTK